MSLALTHLSGFGVGADAGGGGGGADITLTFQAATSSGADASTYNFASQALGTAGANRRIVVAVGSGDGNGLRTITGVTVDGTAAVQAVDNSSSDVRVGIWVADSTANTTGTISVTFSASVNRCFIAVWSMYDSLSATPTNTYTANVDPSSASVNVTGGGCLIACGWHRSTTTATWTGVTEQSDGQVETETFTSGSEAFAATQTGLSVSCDWDSGGTLRWCAAAFR